MGITIHYHGKAKSLEAIDQLIDVIKEIAVTSHWRHRVVQGTVRGTFEPFWGIGYGFIPSQDRMQQEGIEFFPKMVSSQCNGYFRLFHTRYRNAVRTSFEKGERPHFFINTKRKGIQVSLHPQCENLNFIFDVKTLELIDYSRCAHKPGIIFGLEGFSCKTQFAGFEIHQTVCKLIKMASRYIDFSDVDDESKYYDTENILESKNSFELLGNAIDLSIQRLKEMGFDVTSGKEL